MCGIYLGHVATAPVYRRILAASVLPESDICPVGRSDRRLDTILRYGTSPEPICTALHLEI